MSSLQVIFNKTSFGKHSKAHFYPIPPYFEEVLSDLKNISLEEIKSFELNITQLTKEDAQLLLHLLVLASFLRLPWAPYKDLMQVSNAEKFELLEVLNQLNLQASPYLDILPKIAAGEMSSVEAEHYMLRMLHKGQNRKSKKRIA